MKKDNEKLKTELKKLANWIGENWIQMCDNKWVKSTDENDNRLTTAKLIDEYLKR